MNKAVKTVKKKVKKEPVMSKYDPIDFSPLYNPRKILCLCKLATSKKDNNVASLSLPETYTLRSVIKEINNHHNNGCNNIRLFRDSYDSNYIITNLDLTLKDFVFGDRLELYYDFEPVFSELL